ncbi:MAG TPA: Ig-like domain-containing protein [Symbiobacteriaceae bacterium]|jgi:triacylglycerol esterase/lipase EstA (alpha/beta hydrolase family)
MSWTLGSSLGSKSISVTYRDGDGNTSSYSTGVTVKDTRAPVGSISASPSEVSPTSPNVTLAMSASDAGGSLLNDMSVSDSDGHASGWIPYATSKSWTVGTTPGTKTISVDFRDGAGNVGSASTTVNVKDTVPPVPGISAPAQAAGGTAFLVSWSADDGTGSGVAAYEVTLSVNGGAAATWKSGSGASGESSYTGVGGSTYTFAVRAKDVAGNWSGWTSTTVTVSRRLMSIALSPSASTLNIGQTVTFSALGTYDNGATGDATGEVQFSSSSGAVSMSGSTATANSAGSATVTGTHTATGLTATATVAVVADTTAPVIAFYAPVPGSVVTGAVGVVVKALDNVGVANVELAVDGRNPVTLSPDSGVGPEGERTYRYTWDTAGMSGGQHTLRATAWDAAGNTQSVSITVTVGNGDNWEPNESRSAAAQFPLNGTILGLTIHTASDVDYFYITSPDAGRVRVEMQPPYDKHYRLTIEDGLGNFQQYGVAPTNSVVKADFDMAAGARYYLRIESADGSFDPGHVYDIRTTFLAAPTISMSQQVITPLDPTEITVGISHSYRPSLTYSYRWHSVDRPWESRDISVTPSVVGDTSMAFSYDGKYVCTDSVCAGERIPLMKGHWRLEVTASDGIGLSATGVSSELEVKPFRPPVVYLAGFTGSRLYELKPDGSVGDRKWLPEGTWDLEDLEMDANGITKNNLQVMSTGPVLDIGLLAGWSFMDKLGRNLIDRLESPSERWIQGQTLTLWGYDWRQDVRSNAVLLAPVVQRAKLRGGDNVNILAHSMGGLVSKYFMVELGGWQYVNSFVSIGTPYLGAPKTFKVLVAGDDLMRQTSEHVLDSFPGMMQLLPSAAYVNGDGGGYVDVYDYSQGLNLSTDRPIRKQTYAESKALLDRFPYDNDTGTYRNWGYVAKYLEPLHNALDGVAIPGNVKHHAVIGTNLATIVGISERQSFVNAGLPAWGIRYGDGDATVPTKSAKHPSDTTAAANLVYVNNIAHGSLPGSTPVIEYIMGVLHNDGAQPDPAPGGVKYGEPFATLSAETYDVFCPVDVHIYDEAGRHTGPLPDGSIEQGIPGIAYDIIGDSKHWALPVDGDYRIEFAGTGVGTMDLHISHVEGNDVTEKHVFNKVPVDPQMRATMKVPKGKRDHVLSIGQQGRPEVKPLRPHASTLGKENLVRGPAPVAKATVTGKSGRQDWYTSDVRIAFAAADRGKGVLGVYYKREGDATYQPYESALTFDQDGTFTVLAGATDRLGEDQPVATKVIVRIDQTAPTVTAAASGLTLRLTAADATSGVGSVQYSIDGGKTWQNYTAELRFDKPVTVSYRALDVAGNTSAIQTVQVGN